MGGYGGQKFTYHMKDGSILEWTGSWSSRAGVMNRLSFGPCIEVSLTDNFETWKKGYTFFSGAVTVKLLKDFMKKMYTYWELTKIIKEKEPTWQPRIVPARRERIMKKFGIPFGWEPDKKGE